LIIPVAFDFSDGIEASLEAGLPQDIEPFFQMAEHDLDSDYDDFYQMDEGGSDSNYDGPVKTPADIQPPVGAAAPTPVKTVKAYVVKYTAYRTFVGNSRSFKSEMSTNGRNPVYAR
jgi:hypothetical protein